ncbi:MAG: type III pantothenate kinase [Candidatus Thiodiazotropha sp.]
MDFGNSEVKWATQEGLAGGVVQRAASTDLSASLIPKLQSLESPSQVRIASVLQPERLRELCEWMVSNWGVSPRFAKTHESELGVVNGYRPPERLGIDRWLGLLAARSLSKEPLLVVDCGTATTLDGMDGEGRHLGGVILPGLQLFQRCLRSHTDIPGEENSVEISDFATDTAAGISSGAMLATTSAVEAMLVRLRQTCGRQPQCLLTGGFAHRVAGYLTSPRLLVAHLILHGLSLQAGQQD